MIRAASEKTSTLTKGGDFFRIRMARRREGEEVTKKESADESAEREKGGQETPSSPLSSKRKSSITPSNAGGLETQAVSLRRKTPPEKLSQRGQS